MKRAIPEACTSPDTISPQQVGSKKSPTMARRPFSQDLERITEQQVPPRRYKCVELFM